MQYCLLSTDQDVHFFVDEFVFNDGDDLKTLDDISEKIDSRNHVWITVAKVSEIHVYDFEYWLEKKIKEGYIEPSLKYPLRNSKEIINFEKLLRSNMVDSESPVESNIKDIEKSLAHNELKWGKYIIWKFFVS